MIQEPQQPTLLRKKLKTPLQRNKCLTVDSVVVGSSPTRPTKFKQYLNTSQEPLKSGSSKPELFENH